MKVLPCTCAVDRGREESLRKLQLLKFNFPFFSSDLIFILKISMEGTRHHPHLIFRQCLMEGSLPAPLFSTLLIPPQQLYGFNFLFLSYFSFSPFSLDLPGRKSYLSTDCFFFYNNLLISETAKLKTGNSF